MSTSWEVKVADKRSRILASVPSEFQYPELEHSLTDTVSVMSVPEKYLSAKELEITGMSASQVVSAIEQRHFSSVEILNSFTHRTAIAHRLLHSCLAIPYDLALARAKELDAFQDRMGRTSGPLHGLPISVKDQCRLIDTETTCGFVYTIGQVDQDDAVIVKILKKAGANIFAKTSLSIGCMWGETVNNILGRTASPFNRSFSCGGSSGGEGALIGFKASPLGFGSDLGGSIRSPAAYQGLYGLRPSSGRIPYYRMLNGMEGQQTIVSVVGPLARTTEDIELATKVIVDSEPWHADPCCHPLPWRSSIVLETPKRKLKIGIFEWDGVCLPQPPIRNAMKRTVAALKDAGHKVIPWKIDQQRAVELVLKVFRSDAAFDIHRQCAKSGEPPMESGCDTTDPPLHVTESWDLAMECLDFRAKVLQQWNNTGDTEQGMAPMDAYIAPVVPAVAPRHGDYSKVRYFAYTATVNLLDYTACTFPTGFVDPQKDLPDDASLLKDANREALPPPTCERDEMIRRKYNPEIYKGLPVCLQLVGRKLEEEKVILIVRLIRDLLEKKVWPRHVVITLILFPKSSTPQYIAVLCFPSRQSWAAPPLMWG